MDEQNNGAQEPTQQQTQPVTPAQPAAPAKKKMGKGKIAAIVVGVLFVFGIIGSIGGNSQTAASTTTNDKPAATEQAAPADGERAGAGRQPQLVEQVVQRAMSVDLVAEVRRR